MSLAAIYPPYQHIIPPQLNAYTIPAFPHTNLPLPVPVALPYQQQHQHCQLPHRPVFRPLPAVPLSHLTHFHTEVIPPVFSNPSSTSNSSVSCNSSSIFHGPLLLPFSSQMEATNLWIHKRNHLHSIPHFEKSLGYGAFGVVWSACDPRNGERIALKRIPHVFNDVIASKRAYRELFMLKSLHHTNVVSLVDFVMIDNFHHFSDVCVLTEYMDTDLHKIIVSPQALSQDHVKLFFYQILRGVKYLHSAGIVHRDLKPGNLLVNSNCLIKICDFGLARVEEPNCSYLTQEVITQYYRPPELLTGVTRYSFSVDMWSVGCIFAELLSRRILFQASTPLQQLERIVEFLGTPSASDMGRVPEEVRRYLQSLPVVHHSTLPSITHCEEAKALLMALLRWEPDSRLTAVQALESSYVQSGRARFHYTICNCCPKQQQFASTPPAAAAPADEPAAMANNSLASDVLEPVCAAPLLAGFDCGINTVYEGKVKLWALMQDYFARDSRAVRVRMNTMGSNYRSFLGSHVAFRSNHCLNQPGAFWR